MFPAEDDSTSTREPEDFDPELLDNRQLGGAENDRKNDAGNQNTGTKDLVHGLVGPV